MSVHMETDPLDDVDAEEAESPSLGETRLWERWRMQGDPSARDELIELYRPFARVVAATYFGRRIDDDIEFDDYHQWAIVGMIESLDRFDPSREIRFKTFASRRMHGNILDGIESATEKQRQIAARRRLRAERAADALKTAETVAGTGDVADSTDIFKVLAEVGIGLALGLMLEGTGMMAPTADAMSPDNSYAHFELRQLHAAVRACIDKLSEQERHVVQGHYLEDRRFAEVALQLNLTRGRVSQIHKQALEKLRRLLRVPSPLDIAL